MNILAVTFLASNPFQARHQDQREDGTSHGDLSFSKRLKPGVFHSPFP